MYKRKRKVVQKYMRNHNITRNIFEIARMFVNSHKFRTRLDIGQAEMKYDVKSDST